MRGMVGSGGHLRASASGTAVGNAFPARGVIMAGVVSAEAFDEAGLACVAILAEPRVPAAAGFVGGVEEFVIACVAGEFPCSRGDGYDHLDLAVALVCADFVGELDGGGKLAVFLLLGEEGHVVGAGDRQAVWAGLRAWRRIAAACRRPGLPAERIPARCRRRCCLRRGRDDRSAAWSGRFRRARQARRPMWLRQAGSAVGKLRVLRSGRAWRDALRAGKCGCGGGEGGSV